MADIYNKTKKTIIKWKDFQFPLSIKDFSLKEWAKIATYEYAWRNWAEHERVLSHRIFSLSGEFIAWINDKLPKELVKELRLTNDNKPWKFIHTDIGIFTCVMSNLTITQNWESYASSEEGARILTPCFTFSVDLLEHTPPTAKTLKEKNDELFPKSEVKPLSDSYSTSLIYKNCDELFNAIIEEKILAWVNPIINAEWLRYDFDLRACAYGKWEATWFQLWVQEDLVDNVTVNTNQKYYTVKSWDTWMKIAKAYKVTFTSLFAINKWIEVRKYNNGDECTYWKTARLLFPWDKLLIPDWFTEPVKKKSINRIEKPIVLSWGKCKPYAWKHDDYQCLK